MMKSFRSVLAQFIPALPFSLSVRTLASPSNVFFFQITHFSELSIVENLVF